MVISGYDNSADNNLHVATRRRHLRCARLRHRARISASLPAEMFGVRFRGHPDPRTLLMPEDMDDTFPLRKSHPLAEIEVLQGEGMGYTEEDR